MSALSFTSHQVLRAIPELVHLAGFSIAELRKRVQSDGRLYYDRSLTREQLIYELVFGSDAPSPPGSGALNKAQAHQLAEADKINPGHYKQGGIECIDYLRAKLSPDEFRGFLKGNAMKYLSRAEEKGGTEDYKKAAWYTTMLTGKDPRGTSAPSTAKA